MSEEKKKRNIRQIINTKFKDRIEKTGEHPVTSFKQLIKVPKITSGLLEVDDLLGGGIAEGRIMQMYGPESGFKTSIALHIAGTLRKMGHKIAYIDAENAFDPVYSYNLFGVDIRDEKNVFFSQEDDATVIWGLVEIFAENGVKLIIVDSTDAMLAPAVAAGDHGDAHIGQMARINSQSLNKLKRLIKDTGAILILLSQTRTKIGGMGESETTSGGNAIRFYSSVRVRVVRTVWIPKTGSDPKGALVKMKCRKNKAGGIPFRECELTYMFDGGFIYEAGLIDVGKKYGVIRQGGGTFYYTPSGTNEELKFKGKEGIVNYLRDNPEESKICLDRIHEGMNRIVLTSFDDSETNGIVEADGEADDKVEQTDVRTSRPARPQRTSKTEQTNPGSASIETEQEAPKKGDEKGDTETEQSVSTNTHTNTQKRNKEPNTKPTQNGSKVSETSSKPEQKDEKKMTYYMKKKLGLIGKGNEK